MDSPAAPLLTPIAAVKDAGALPNRCLQSQSRFELLSEKKSNIAGEELVLYLGTYFANYVIPTFSFFPPSILLLNIKCVNSSSAYLVGY